MNIVTIAPVVFSILITIHNIEEAIWLPEWSKNAGSIIRPTEVHEFRFAVSVLTVLAYMISIVVGLNGYNSLYGYIFWGYMGAMILNSVFPHLALTIVKRRYVPGLVTGFIINCPIFVIIALASIKEGIISAQMFLISTVVMSVVLLLGIRPLFYLGKVLWQK